jgi:hypothetical protein
MATTTNFGWETPDDTDLVKDGALAMRTLGNAIDTSLVDLKGGTTGQNLRKNSNTDMDFTWAGDATNTVIDAEGDLLVGDSVDTLQRLAIGTTGQVLTVDTAVDGKIKWATAAGGGKVLQVVTATTTSSTTVTSTTFTDSTITASITPSATTSKILVLATMSINAQRSAAGSDADVRLMRGATAIASWNGTDARFVGIALASGTYTQHWHTTTVSWLDSPSTTSSTTYKIQGRPGTTADSGSITFQFSSAPSSITLLEIGA